ncbi:unnamed protein product [Haemonchus placei]|uniref:Secreted protein n=1 Tax=Haemonchus placei TaxID=6290 RepID=A0A0N4WBJ4_HAEPC|nr:unnamed protein product [Haemonchus placei]
MRRSSSMIWLSLELAMRSVLDHTQCSADQVLPRHHSNNKAFKNLPGLISLKVTFFMVKWYS